MSTLPHAASTFNPVSTFSDLSFSRLLTESGVILPCILLEWGLREKSFLPKAGKHAGTEEPDGVKHFEHLLISHLVCIDGPLPPFERPCSRPMITSSGEACVLLQSSGSSAEGATESRNPNLNRLPST